MSLNRTRSYAIQYLRPDGWWEAGRGWADKYAADRDATEQMEEGVKWRVVLVGSKKDKEKIG